MYSFYGGRPGTAFVIARTFESVNDMVTNFSQGSQYSDVHYDEYVLINTPDRNDKDNGKIYRRGYNYSNSMGGAEYLGRITGPSGPAPALIPTSYEHIFDDGSTEKPTATIYNNNTNPVLQRDVPQPGFVYIGDQTQGQIQAAINLYRNTHTEKETNQWILDTYGIETLLNYTNYNINNEKTIITQGKWSVHNGGLVPGNQSKTISWKAASFTDSNGEETNGYFSMKVPYPITDFYAQKVRVDSDPAQYPLIEDFTDNVQLNGEPAVNYPFYKAWMLNLPIVYPISVTNNSWQGIGKLYDDGNNGAMVDGNVQGTKRLYFNIPLNAPILPGSFTLVQISGRLNVDSLGVIEQRNTSDFNNNETPVPYFNLDGSIIKDAIFFKTTVGYQIYQSDDPTAAVVQQGNEYLYTKNGIINTNNVISFNDEYQVARVNNIYANSFGLCVDLFTNLKTSMQEKTDFVLVRIAHLSLRFYNYSLVYENRNHRENAITADIYQNETLPSPVVYTQLKLVTQDGD